MAERSELAGGPTLAARVWARWPAPARSLAGAGGLVAAALATRGPAGLALAAALLVVLALAGVTMTSRTPRPAWRVFVGLVVGLAAAAGALHGADPAALAVVLLLQAAAGLAGPSRPTAVAGALAAGLAAAGAAWWFGAAAPGVWWLVPAAGVAFAGVTAQLLDTQARLERRMSSAPPAPAVGQTRAQLAQVQRDLDILTSQLRRESKQRRQAESQALEAIHTRNAFLAIMSHELRTPLHQIIGYSELLLEELEDGEPAGSAAQDIGRIHFASLNLLEMISNVLDLSKIEAGTTAISAEPVDPVELVEGLVQSFASAALRRGNTLRVRCPEGLGPLRTDRTKLRTILANFLSNACKFTQGGTIRLAVTPRDVAGAPWLEFEVSDTGIGIQPEQIERLFAPFVQADGGVTRRHDGSGLGLAIARHFCVMIGGEISVDSTPGAGSSFRVRVPRDYVDPRHAGHILTSLAAP